MLTRRCVNSIGQGGFCTKVIINRETQVPKPAPTPPSQGGFCTKVIINRETQIPKPAPTPHGNYHTMTAPLLLGLAAIAPE